jgi:hypothetical protein
MAAHVQLLGSVENSTAGQTSTVISPSSKTVTAGNVIVVGWGTVYDITPSSVTDNLGNTYVRAERVRNPGSNNTADLWYAPVTTGGSITTITVNHASTQYLTAVASEFSGVGSLSVAGGGTYGNGITTTWVTSQTVPAGGLAVGASFTNNDSTHVAGSSSGSPSTSIASSGMVGGTSGAVSLEYALAAGTTVTAFSGTTTIGGTYQWAAAGAVFSPAVTSPVWTTPADTVSMSTTPELKFNSPTSAVKQHFYLELDTANTFNTGNLRTYRSDQDQTNWAYWDGSAWTAMPSDGLPIAKSGNEIRYTVTSALSSATWYRRVRAGTLA